MTKAKVDICIRCGRKKIIVHKEMCKPCSQVVTHNVKHKGYAPISKFKQGGI